MTLRVALIGCGDVARHHVASLRAAGFEVVAVAGKPDSARARQFATDHGIPRVAAEPAALVSDPGHDALVLATDPVATPSLLARAVEDGRPTLVEKPVAFASRELESLEGRAPRVLVGYNRRFYATSLAARDEAARGPALIRLVCPERSPDKVVHNAVHGFDLLRFVAGPLELAHVEHVEDRSIAALLRGAAGHVVVLNITYAVPDNVGLTIERAGLRLELRPWEQGTVYDALEIDPPRPERPVRAYLPRVARRIQLDPEDSRLKPGFGPQARALAALVRGEEPPVAARLDDALAALRLAEALSSRGG